MFDEGQNYRAKIGFVLLATEQTIEENMFRLSPEGVGVHFTRAMIPDSITTKAFMTHANDLSRAASTLLPDGSLDVICYACTSGSLVIGEERVFNELSQGAPHAKTTSLITAVISALKILNIKTIAVATPYLDEINEQEVIYLENAGFKVSKIKGLNLEKDSDMIRVKPDYIQELAESVNSEKADAVFISCGALRSIDIIDELEQKLEKPVITSNQAMMWECLRLAGIKDQIQGYGKLLSEY